MEIGICLYENQPLHTECDYKAVPMSSPNEKLYDLLQQQAPGSVLLIGRSPVPALATYCEQQSCKVTRSEAITPDEVGTLAHHDLILVADCLEHCPPSEGRLLLGALRNRLNPRILVAVDEQRAGWGFTDFLGLGFRREAHFAQAGQSLSLYGYDLANYNHKRSWNTPENWANPENWGKFWW